MVKQRQMKKNNNNKVAKKRNPSRAIPLHYPKAPGDTMVMPFKTTGILTVPAGSNTVGKLFVLGRGTSSGDYVFLNSASAQFSAIAQISSRWMITNLRVEVRATGVGGTANTFIAASYIPSHTGVDNPPLSLSEVSQAIHYAESSLGTVGRLQVEPTDYYNDWRQTVDEADASDSQAGLIQLYGSGTPDSSGVTAGVYTISGVFHFCGLRI